MKRLLGIGLLLLGGGLFFYLSKPTPASAPVSAARTPAVAQAPAAGGGGKSSRAPASAHASRQDEFAQVKACYESESCNFPKTDPRSYSIAVGHRLAALLEEALASGDPDLGPLARDSMQIDDGFVQEAAMKIISSLPPSRENVEAIISGLEHTSDPLLIEQAMNEWERYLGSPEEAAIQEFLADFIARGGQFSSEKASEQILKFLNERSYPTFQAALASMEPESTPAKNLRAALKEYDRQRMGG